MILDGIILVKIKIYFAAALVRDIPLAFFFRFQFFFSHAMFYVLICFK